MEVHITQEQESQLALIAQRQGKANAGELLKDAAIQLIEENASFRRAVLEGIAEADRNEFIEETEMDARFEQLLQS